MSKQRTKTPSSIPPMPSIALNSIQNPEALAKIGASAIDMLKRSQDGVAALTVGRVLERASKPGPRGPSKRDIDAVNRRLYDVVSNLRAMHRLMWVVEDRGEDGEAAQALFEEVTRSSARAVDACRKRLGETITMDCFVDDLAND